MEDLKEHRTSIGSVEQIKRELSPYILPQEYIDDKSNEKIGAGSYGSITKIMYCGTPCAAKELHSILLPDDESALSHGGNNTYLVNEFCKEIKILSKIQHPNFVRFIGIYFKGNSPYPLLVMELMHNSLDQCLVQYGHDSQKLPVSTKLFILRDVARAVAYIHCQNPPVVHRDLTVKNVLLTFSMTAKVADLGVAKYVTKQLSTQCPGNVLYMPPEALKRDPLYGTEVDVYSFGVLGLHVFSGEWPLQHGLRKDDDSAYTDLERCHVDKIGEGFSVKEMLTKCLHADPKKRLKAREILTQVEAVTSKYEIKGGNFLEIQYNARNYTMVVDTMAGMVRDLKSSEEFIKKLQMQKIETSNIKDLTETNKQLEDEKTELAREVARLRNVIQHQQDENQKLSSGIHTEKHNSTSQQLIDAECEANLRCFALTKEKESLSDKIEKLVFQISTLSDELDSKDKQLQAKKSELEENNTQWVNTVRTLKQEVIQSEGKIRGVQEQYNKLLQDLLIPHMVSIVYFWSKITHCFHLCRECCASDLCSLAYQLNLTKRSIYCQ